MSRLAKTVRFGRGEYGDVFARVEFDGKRLSICGVEGPKKNGDARGSCGQIDGSFSIVEFAPGWTQETLDEFLAIWRDWHLNDMRAGCKHQRQDWNRAEQLEVVSYGLTHEAYRLREKSILLAAQAHAEGATLELDETAKALVLLEDWFQDRHEPPDADSPLSGCYEVKKRETRTAGWVRPSEHPKGLLCRPCGVCGYEYGSAWLTEEVPESVLKRLAEFPETDKTPAWV